MKQINFSIAAFLLAGWFLISNSCLQINASGTSSASLEFVATTPCNENLKKILNIPVSDKSEMVRWSLKLNYDEKTSAPSGFNLTCMYGMPKQGTKDLMPGATTIELKGKWAIIKGTKENAKAVVYKLTNDNSPISLSFLSLDQNLLHLLDGDRSLMVGSAAWSYTLNRINPVTASANNFVSQNSKPPRIATDSIIVGIFEGRATCIDDLRELNGISSSGCQLVKCRLTLYQDVKTHEPTSFFLNTIYVGKGDTKYSNTGKWTITQGVNADKEAVVYTLEADKPQVSISLMKADNNILFFLDKNRNLLVGNNYCSFTLNRNRK
jgi:hypothetical protein